MAIRDRIDRSLIHFYETLTGKIAGDGELKHQVQFIVAKSNQKFFFYFFYFTHFALKYCIIMPVLIKCT